MIHVFNQEGLVPPLDIDAADVLTGSDVFDRPWPGDDPKSVHKQDDHSKLAQRNDSISCDLGLSYPLLQSIFSGHKNHQTLQVNCLN